MDWLGVPAWHACIQVEATLLFHSASPRVSFCKELTGMKSLRTSLLFTSVLKCFGEIRSSNLLSEWTLSNSDPCPSSVSDIASFLVFFLSSLSGVLHTSVVLLTEMCERSPDMLAHFRKVGPFSLPKPFLIQR